MSDEIPVTCRLSNEELRRREATLIAQFNSLLLDTNELENGYAFRVPGDNKSLELVIQLMTAERECCPFLTFELMAEPNSGSLTLRVSGPVGTKDFLQSTFGICAPS